MLPELSARLSRAIEQKRLKEKLEQDLHTVETELKEKTTLLAKLSTQLEKEKIDLEKLERISLTSWFYSVLGSREQQIEKERQELLSAQLLHQQSKNQVGFLQQEKNKLLEQLKKLQGAEREFTLVLAEKEKFLQQSNQIIAKELFDISAELAHLNLEVQEITEALNAGNNVLSDLNAAIKSLESASNWGTWDMIGVLDFISDMLKRSDIDDARDSVHSAQTKISQFKRELADVKKDIEIQINISELAHFADYFFDGLIVDWIVQEKIEDALEQARKAQNIISQAIQDLKNLKETTQNKRNDLQTRRVQLLANN